MAAHGEGGRADQVSLPEEGQSWATGTEGCWMGLHRNP